jgi:hypothetical protein
MTNSPIQMSISQQDNSRQGQSLSADSMRRKRAELSADFMLSL